MDHTVVGVGAQDFVSHEIGAAQNLVALLEQDLGTHAGNRRRQGAGKDHPGRDALADTAGNRNVLQAEDLRQDYHVFVLQQYAHFLHHLFPDAVHGAGNLHRAHFAGALLQFFHLGQVQETDAAAHPLLFQALGQEGGEEIVVAQEVHDERLPGKLGRREQVDVLQRQGRFLEGAHGHQAYAGGVVQAHAGLGEEVDDTMVGVLHALEAAREEMQGVLSGADDGGALSCLLQGNAGHHAGQAATYDNGIEFHKPNTCL